MKKISIILTIIGLFFNVSTTSVFALNLEKMKEVRKPYLPKLAASDSGEPKREQKKETILNNKTENLKQRASNEISRRIASLTSVSNRISEMKRLTDAQKSLLIGNIQAEIASLTALNSKIQADTDIETMRADVKSIVTSYRVYLLYLPQTRIIVAANGLLNTADKLGELATKLQSRINEAKGKGEDTSVLETTLADMQAKIADAKTKANNAINKVSSLQPTDYPGNKPSLQSGRSILQEAREDLITARQDGQKIIVALRKLDKNITETPIITASPSAASITNIPTE